MAKLTLLQLTQKILNSMDSDDVNDIDDTEEAKQVVDIIENTYLSLMSTAEWNHLKKPQQMESLADSNFPSTLKIPDTVRHLEDFRYEVRESATDDLEYKTLIWKDPIEFTELVLNRNSTGSNIVTSTVKGASTPLLIKNDVPPSYWTSYDDTHITMDAYDSDIESTVQGSKSLAYCSVIPTFNSNSAAFVPECPIDMFPVLLAEATRACFFYLKEQDSPIDAKRIVAGSNFLKQKGARSHERDRRVRFGRR